VHEQALMHASGMHGRSAAAGLPRRQAPEGSQ
jgi:hypothetical protein